MEERWRAAWATALDELEISLEQAERLLGHDNFVPPSEPPPPWHPPAVGGPPPPEQLERAHQLLERHLHVARDLAAALTATRQQLALTARFDPSRPDQTSVYVDVSG